MTRIRSDAGKQGSACIGASRSSTAASRSSCVPLPKSLCVPTCTASEGHCLPAYIAPESLCLPAHISPEGLCTPTYGAPEGLCLTAYIALRRSLLALYMTVRESRWTLVHAFEGTESLTVTVEWTGVEWCHHGTVELLSWKLNLQSLDAQCPQCPQCAPECAQCAPMRDEKGGSIANTLIRAQYLHVTSLVMVSRI